MKTLDTRTIIVNLLKEDKKTYLSVDRLRKLLVYIYKELKRTEQLSNYETHFDINFTSIERTVLYNNHIFKLDIYGEMIYLRETESVEVLAKQFKTDDIITAIIDKFINANVA